MARSQQEPQAHEDGYRRALLDLFAVPHKWFSGWNVHPYLGSAYGWALAPTIFDESICAANPLTSAAKPDIPTVAHCRPTQTNAMRRSLSPGRQRP